MRRRPCSRPDPEGGLALIGVLLLVLISSILLSAAMPVWTTVVRREKEDDLIYRGEQYMAAIEDFQMTVGRPPSKLEELIEFKTIDQKRFIRKLYPDPMSKDGKWELIYADSNPYGGGSAQRPWERNRTNRSGGADGSSGTGGMARNVGVNDDSGGDFPAPEATPVATGPRLSDARYSMPGRESRQQLKGGFILGVKSKCADTSIRLYQGKESYDQWEFRARLIRRVADRQREFHKSMYETETSKGGPKGGQTGRTLPNLRYKGGMERRMGGSVGQR